MKLIRNISFREDILTKLDTIAATKHLDRSACVAYLVENYSEEKGKVWYNQSKMDLILTGGKFEDAQHFVHSMVSKYTAEAVQKTLKTKEDGTIDTDNIPKKSMDYILGESKRKMAKLGINELDGDGNPIYADS